MINSLTDSEMQEFRANVAAASRDAAQRIRDGRPMNPTLRINQRISAAQPEHAELLSRIANETITALGVEGELDDLQAARVERAMSRAQDTLRNRSRLNTYNRQGTRMEPADIALLESRYLRELAGFGGKMENAVGVSADQLRKAAKSAVCKINIDSDGRLVMTAIIRKVFAEKPGEFDPRKYLGPAREELVKMYAEKNKTVLGSAGRV